VEFGRDQGCRFWWIARQCHRLDPRGQSCPGLGHLCLGPNPLANVRVRLCSFARTGNWETGFLPGEIHLCVPVEDRIQALVLDAQLRHGRDQTCKPQIQAPLITFMMVVNSGLPFFGGQGFCKAPRGSRPVSWASLCHARVARAMSQTQRGAGSGLGPSPGSSSKACPRNRETMSFHRSFRSSRRHPSGENFSQPVFHSFHFFRNRDGRVRCLHSWACACRRPAARSTITSGPWPAMKIHR